MHDLLHRWREGELAVDIPVLVSNHTDHAEAAEWFGVEYHHLPIVSGDKVAQEAQVREVLCAHDVDLVVLARYMQILSPEFCDEWAERIINIHHSFLPSFQGARPYHQAHQRGVKLIGVTAHYVLAQREDDRADGGRVAVGRGNAATSSTKNRVQHAQVIGAGVPPALPGRNSAASVSPVASAKHNSG